jgi:subtilisin family serine protease
MAKKLGLSFLLFSFLAVFFQNCGQNGFGVKSPPTSDFASSSSTDDPLFLYAWHLNNTGQKVFSQSTGVAGIDMGLQQAWNAGIYGEGINILVSDDGVDYKHEDLEANFAKTKEFRDYLVTDWLSYTAIPADADFHGTSVSGLIASVGWNGKGSIGVAPKAKLLATNFMSNDVTKSSDVIADQAKGTVDIVNMSWGYSQSNYTSIDPSFSSQLRFGVDNGRSGKGTIYVRSAGNARLELITRSINDYRLGSANFDGNNVTPYTINVGAIFSNGKNAYYSSPGPSLWISGPGGEDGTTSPAMVTTDRIGCTLGYANQSVSATTAAIGSGFQKGSNGNTGCNYTATFNGTSSAAPNVTGGIALLLQAYPKLTWRDVKYILAKTALKAQADLDQSENYLYQKNSTRFANHKSPTGYVWDDGWVINDAGFNFNNLFGFGIINVDAAIAFAKTYTTLFSGLLTEKDYQSTGLSLAVPDFNKDGVTNTISVTDDVRIESIQIEVSVSHANAGELAVELISPNNKRSVLVHMNNSLDGTTNMTAYKFLTNKFYFESSLGDWKIKIIDGRSGNSGTLTAWKLKIAGQLQ